MIEIHFIDYQQGERSAEAEAGDSLMEVAQKNGIPGIEAECGGACACATCHVYIEGNWSSVVPEASEMESDMLGVVNDYQQNSRLACQVFIEESMNGMIVRTPKNQF